MSNGALKLLAASGAKGQTKYIGVPHTLTSNKNFSLYSLSGNTLTKEDDIGAKSNSSNGYQCVFNPNPDTYGNILALTTDNGVSILDYTDGTLSELDTAGSSGISSYGCAYSADGSKLFVSGTTAGYIYRYDQATNGTLSNQTQSGALGVSEIINSIAIAKTKDVGIVGFNNGSVPGVGARAFTPSDFSLDGSVVTNGEEVYGVDINKAGTYGGYTGKDGAIYPGTGTKTNAGRIVIDSSNNLTVDVQLDTGSPTYSLRFSEDDNYIAVAADENSASFGKYVRVYNSSFGLVASINTSNARGAVVWDQDSGHIVFNPSGGGSLLLYSFDGSALSLEQTISSLPVRQANIRMAVSPID